MANFGKVRGGKGRAEAMAKAKPPTAGSKLKPAATVLPGPATKTNNNPVLAQESKRTVVRIKPKPKTSSTSKIVSATPTIAGLVARCIR